jgi:hypothetical protein
MATRRPATSGRRQEAARLIARYGPDLTVTLERLGNDPRVPGYRRVPLRLAARWRSVAIDPIRDSVPLVGRADAAVTRSLVLRLMLRGTNEEMIREAWPGPDAPLRLLLGAMGLAGSVPRPRLPFLK